MKLNFYPKVEKSLDKLQPKEARQILMKLIELSSNAFPNDSKKLKGYKNDVYRVDSGEFRIAYKVIGDTVEIVMIGKRNDDEIYEKLSRVEK